MIDPALLADLPLLVPLPGEMLAARPEELTYLAGYIRTEMRALVLPGRPTATYKIELPSHHRISGSATVLLRLADRLAAAAQPEQRARLMSRPAGDRGTQRLVEAMLYPPYDPSDPDSGPGPQLYPYHGQLWIPVADAPAGWLPYGAIFHIREWSIRCAAVALAAREAIELADDELLAVRYDGAPEPTCFLDAGRVRYARQLLKPEGGPHP